jgi:DNA-directed RNA polymerase subunit RPC12/RpoP
MPRIYHHLSPRECPICKTIFHPKHYLSKYCKPRCQWDAKKKRQLETPPSSKVCAHCKEEKPWYAFHRCATSSDLLQPWCKGCTKERKAPRIVYICEDCGKECSRRADAQSNKLPYKRCNHCAVRRMSRPIGKASTSYKGTAFFPGRLCAAWRCSAKRRGHSWLLTREDLDSQYRIQNGKCALSGIEMDTSHSSPYRPSIDRIDSSQGYILGNVQFICSIINMMKNRYPEPLFLDMCKKITLYQDSCAL